MIFSSYLSTTKSIGIDSNWRTSSLLYTSNIRSQLLETIDWCLCLDHLYRPQSVFALQKALTVAHKQPVPKKTWIGGLVTRFKGTAVK